MSAIERLLTDLESGSEDDRSVAHSCRVELDTLARANAELRAALEKCIETLESLKARRSTCGDPDAECPLFDVHKPYDDVNQSLDAARVALTTAEAKK